MSIVFDQVDGVVQKEASQAAPAPEGEDPRVPRLEPTKLLRELARAQRRRERLRAD